MSADGVVMVPVTTTAGTFNVWTRWVGENSHLRVLFLHGGPGVSHEYLLALERPLVEAGVEVWFYDQLGSALSDQPDDPSLWEVDRFVDEVEQVRTALGFGPDNFVLAGHYWGGILAIEYALRYQQHLKGLVVSNMMSSSAAYNQYVTDVLLPAMEPEAQERMADFMDGDRVVGPLYDELMITNLYTRHVLRRPMAQWPTGVLSAWGSVNPAVFLRLAGPTQLGFSGALAGWDRSADLGEITVPALVIGATHDTQDPAHLRWMAEQMPQGSYLHCPDGSHFAHIDDHEVYVAGLLEFLHGVDGSIAAPAR